MAISGVGVRELPEAHTFDFIGIRTRCRRYIQVPTSRNIETMIAAILDEILNSREQDMYQMTRMEPMCGVSMCVCVRVRARTRTRLFAENKYPKTSN